MSFRSYNDSIRVVETMLEKEHRPTVIQAYRRVIRELGWQQEKEILQFEADNDAIIERDEKEEERRIFEEMQRAGRMDGYFNRDN